jgi:hypothetical protein
MYRLAVMPGVDNVSPDEGLYKMFGGWALATAPNSEYEIL